MTCAVPIDTIKIDRSFIRDIEGGHGVFRSSRPSSKGVDNEVQRRAPLPMPGGLHWTFVKSSLAR